MIETLAIGLSLALLLGIIMQRCRLSPLVGYLIAGIIVGSLVGTKWLEGLVPGETVHEMVENFSHIGVVLLLFGVGLQFHIKDLLAVQRVAVPGAIVCMVARALLGAVFYYWLAGETTWVAALMFGACMCISSTVVLTRVLEDNKILSTPSGHTALGWLVVEDIFTIVLLVLLPVFFEGKALGPALGWLAMRLVGLILVVLFLSKWVITPTLRFVSRIANGELFTLSVLVLALGIAVLSSAAFGISLEFGAFLSGMVVGQGKFSARAASDALPMRDAFAVLFFVSVGMGFDWQGLWEQWPIALSAVLLTLFAKPIVAYIVVRFLKQSSRMALLVSTSLSQVGEFSFILASLIESKYELLPHSAVNVITGTAIISIVLNASLYRYVPRLIKYFEDRGIGVRRPTGELPEPAAGSNRVIIVGYGPCGKTLADILSKYKGVEVVVIEMNIDTVARLNDEGVPALHGDARQRTILTLAGVEQASAIIITSVAAPTAEITATAHSLVPGIAVMAYTAYSRSAYALRKELPDDDRHSLFFSGEEEVALAMTRELLKHCGLNETQVERELHQARTNFELSNQTPEPQQRVHKQGKFLTKLFHDGRKRGRGKMQN